MDSKFIPEFRDPVGGNGALYPAFERDAVTKIKTGLKIEDGNVRCALIAGRTKATVLVPATLFGDLSTCKVDAKQRQYLPCSFIGDLWRSTVVNANTKDYDRELRNHNVEYRPDAA